MSITSTAAPRWGRIPTAVERTGIGRGKLYQIAAQHPGLFKKLGAATVVDLELLDTILAELPDAELGKELSP